MILGAQLLACHSPPKITPGFDPALYGESSFSKLFGVSMQLLLLSTHMIFIYLLDF